MTHAELLALSPEVRQWSKVYSNWRLGNFEAFSVGASAIYRNALMREICATIFQVECYPHFSRAFGRGSRQNLHQDMAVFHVMPRNYLIGAWVATEDIHADSGPLVFYPGSHRSPFFHQFDHYPYTNLRTCSPEDTQAYDAFLTQEAKGYPQKTFVCEKGDILFWHGMLIHGGHPIRNEALSRRSFVVHFLPERSNWAPKVEGPSNW